MNRLFCRLLPVLLLFLPGMRARAQGDQPTATLAAVAIKSPSAGEVLQGNVPITGYIAVDGFLSSEVSFAYSHDLTGTWFLIHESSEAVASGILARWDTTTLTDGEYTLRLRVSLQDGSQLTTTIADLRVRNYTPIETNTPTPVAPTATPLPGDTPLPTITPTSTITPAPPTATTLPPNPAQLTPQNIFQSFGKGVLVVVGLFAVGGLYRMAKRMRTTE